MPDAPAVALYAEFRGRLYPVTWRGDALEWLGGPVGTGARVVVVCGVNVRPDGDLVRRVKGRLKAAGYAEPDVREAADGPAARRGASRIGGRYTHEGGQS